MKRTEKTKNMARCALFAAVIAVVAPFTVPLGTIPVSLASLAVMAAFSWATTLLYDLPMARRTASFRLLASAREALSLGGNTLSFQKSDHLLDGHRVIFIRVLQQIVHDVEGFEFLIRGACHTYTPFRTGMAPPDGRDGCPIYRTV